MASWATRCSSKISSFFRNPTPTKSFHDMGASSSTSLTSLPLILISDTETPCLRHRATVFAMGSNSSCTFASWPFTSRRVRMIPLSVSRPSSFSEEVSLRPSVERVMMVSTLLSLSRMLAWSASKNLAIQRSTLPVKACLMGITFTRTWPTSVGLGILLISSRTPSYLVSAAWNLSKSRNSWPSSEVVTASFWKSAKKTSKSVSHSQPYPKNLSLSSSRFSSVSFKVSVRMPSVMHTMGFPCSSRMKPPSGLSKRFIKCPTFMMAPMHLFTQSRTPPPFPPDMRTSGEYATAPPTRSRLTSTKGCKSCSLMLSGSSCSSR
mmetsp:Transcript_49271/g.99167  ORF Transcript_49271/g.99167 Transcript_49271/m.99167 type:complete len:320 (+) Transcript_49271:4456-5415(+)